MDGLLAQTMTETVGNKTTENPGHKAGVFVCSDH